MLAAWCGALLLALATAPPAAGQTTDPDGDGLPSAWETQFGLDPNSAVGPDGALGDPDGDGFTNAQELAAGTHPRGTTTRIFAEGATGSFFDTRFALFNANLVTPARTLIRYLRSDGLVVPQMLTLLPGQRVTIDPEKLTPLASAAFSTIVEADAEVVADRTMMWDQRHYGSHAETGVSRPSMTWYLAEGATHLNFNLFYLLVNPNSASTTVTVTYLLGEGGPPFVKAYTIGPNSRANIWVDEEDPLLASADVSSIIQSTLPIVVERAMYANNGGLPFGAGHASAAIPAPALEWFLAEGATGDFFDEFILIANPNAETANLAVTYLLPTGSTIVRNYQVGPKRRYTIYVDNESRRLANTAVSAIVRSTNGVPVVVERAMWWPGPAYGANWWREGHSSPGSTHSASRWALAEGDQDGPDQDETYILIANTGMAAATARVTLFFENGGTAATQLAIGAQNRATIRVASVFPDAAGKRFASMVESVGGPASFVVERAMYSTVMGDVWAGGTNALGTPIDSVAVPANPAAITITASDPQALEQGLDAGVFTIARSAAGPAQVVAYAVSGSATPGTDYKALLGTVTIPDGALSTTVVVTPVEDSLAEPTETITLSLLPDPRYTIAAPATATVSLQDNDTVVVPESDIDAARFLTQATFGPTPTTVQEVRTLGYDAWITQQTQKPVSSFLAFLDRVNAEDLSEDDLQEAWFTYAVNSPDQLRLRVANALIEILVVSSANGLEGIAEAQGAYMDILQRDAFANYRTLLEDVTLSPSMGQYLSHLKNDKPGPDHNPDENYGREVLQLFSIGLNQLNSDGTLKRDGAGNPIPTYTQDIVRDFAHVFTGWTYAHTGSANFYYADENWREPMRGIQSHHSTKSKTLLNGLVVPANQTMQEDLRQALDNIFTHPNVGPFISRQLIQRLVTGNPSPNYVARVAAVFANNGAGVRGDLLAVVRAILLDPDARTVATARGPYFGHLKEPMIRFVQVLRAFRASAMSGKFRITRLEDTVGQAPFRSSSVFNFFSPNYRKPGTLASLGLYSPEFQIQTEQWVIAWSNTMRRVVADGYGYDEDRLVPDLSIEIGLAGNPPALAERLNTLLFAGMMSADLRNIIVEAVESLPATEAEARAQLAASLAITSAEFVVQK